MTVAEIRMWAFERAAKDAGTGATPEYLTAQADELVAWVMKDHAMKEPVLPQFSASASSDYQKRMTG